MAEFWKGMLKFTGILAGLCICAGAVGAWHYWNMDGFVAFLVAGAGVTLCGRAID